jgi:hypothetical protein
LRNDLGGVPILTVAVGPLAGLEATLDIDAGSFGEVLIADFTELVPRDNAEPLGLFVGVAIFVAPRAVARHSEGRYCASLSSVTHFRIGTEMTSQLYFVEVFHGFVPFPISQLNSLTPKYYSIIIIPLYRPPVKVGA